FDVGRIEVGSAIEPHKFTPEHFDLRVVFDHRRVAVDDHCVLHGFTPCVFSHSRMDATAPLSVVGAGCGRWNTRRSPNSLTPTREPSRSLISAPSSISNASMARHSVLQLGGRVEVR